MTDEQPTQEDISIFQHKDAEALQTALYQLGVWIRYNLRRQRPEMAWGNEDRDKMRWEAMNDRNTGDLRRMIAERYQYERVRRDPAPLHFGESAWNLWLNALLHHVEVDPFKQWLTAKARPKWDNTGRLDSWLSDVFGIAGGNTELVQWASRFIFLGCTWRTMEPGIKLDEMPVLIGPQGIGKSTALRLALPPDIPDLFNDGLHLAANPQIRAEALMGRAIVEASEMAGSTRAELESLKAFLSQTDDGGIRLAYRRNPEAMPRRCIIVGTSNNPECLPNDPSGNRRFVPVILIGGDPAQVTAYLNDNRAQLWAEARTLYQWGKEEPERAITARLPDHLKTAQRDAAEQARRKDEVMEDAIDSALAAWGDHPVSLGDLIKKIDMQGERNISHRAAAYLRNLGYEKVNRDNRKVWIKR